MAKLAKTISACVLKIGGAMKAKSVINPKTSASEVAQHLNVVRVKSVIQALANASTNRKKARMSAVLTSVAQMAAHANWVSVSKIARSANLINSV